MEKTPALEAALCLTREANWALSEERAWAEPAVVEFRAQTFPLPAVKSFSGLTSPIR